MPDQLAHFIFARRVLDACGPALRSRVPVDGAAFRLGSFGPDPLFNDPSAALRAEGFSLHRMRGRVGLERLRPLMQDDAPHAAAFTAGFFCHYAMDRLFHPHILALAERSGARHIAIETAYDRQLCLRQPELMPRHFRPGPGELAAGARAYLHVTPGRLGRDIRAFWQLKRLVRFTGGTAVAPVVGALAPRLKGYIPYRQPDAAISEGIDMLDTLMERCVAPAAEQLEACFHAYDRGLPLPDWVDADFSGRFSGR